MLKKIATATVAVSAVFAATQASAISGITINGNAGYVSQSSKSEQSGAGIPATPLDKRDKDHFAWSALIGYNYDFDPDWGISAEVGYGDYGQTKWRDAADTASYSADQTAILLLFGITWHADELLDLFFKVGPAFGHTDVSATPNFGDDEKDGSNTQAMIALGLNYKFTPEFGINLHWEHIFGDDINIDDYVAGNMPSSGSHFQTVNAVMLGLNYTFEV